MVTLSVNPSYETNSYHFNFSCPVVFGNTASAQNLALNKAVTVSSVEEPLQEILLSMVISIRGGEVHLTSQNTFKWILVMSMH